MITETLTVEIGTSLAKAIIKSWIDDSDLVADGVSDAAKLLTDAGMNFRERRRVIRELDEITERVAERLATFFQAEQFGGLPEGEQYATASAVARTIDTGFTDPAIALRADLDPQRLETHLREACPEAAEEALLSPLAARLYDIALTETCACLVAMVENLPNFAGKAYAELLERDRAIMEKLDEALDHLQSASVDSATDFETRYHREVARALDKLRLYGLPGGDSETQRYRLSVAYLSLTVGLSDWTWLDSDDDDDAFEDWEDGCTNHSPAAASGDEDVRVMRIDQVLGAGSRFLIRGDAGSGKTTLLQWLSVSAAREAFEGDLEHFNELVPFFLPLRRYSGRDLPGPGGEFIRTINQALEGLLPQGWVEATLDSGRGLILVDGVDELPVERREEIQVWLDELLSAFPACTVIVTSRPPAVDDDWLSSLGFAHCFLEPMSTLDIDVFIHHWHAAIATEVSAEEQTTIGEMENHLKQVIRKNAATRRLATSPLLCAMLCALNRAGNAYLPEDRIEIYRITLEVLLQTREAARKVHRTDLPALVLQRKLLIFQDLAYWLVRNGYADVPRQLAEAQVEKSLERVAPDLSAELVFESLLQRTGLLREPSEGRIELIHKTFLEYLAARAVVDADDIGVLLEHTELDAWAEIIVLAAGCAIHGQRHQLIAGLLDKANDSPESANRLHLLAAACVEGTPELDPALTARVRATLERLVPPKSVQEAETLAAAGALAAPLLGPKDHMKASEARACIRALGLIGTDDALQQIALFREDPRITVIRELIAQWINFDLNEYAITVLENCPLEEGVLVVGPEMPLHAASHLRALYGIVIAGGEGRGRVRGLASLSVESIDVIGEAEVASLAELGSKSTVRAITLAGQGQLESLEGLHGFEVLSTLSIIDCEHLQELLPDYEEWPKSLTSLALAGKSLPDDGSLMRARIKTLDLGGEIGSLEEVVPGTVEALVLRDITSDLDLFPLIDLPRISNLQLRHCTGKIEVFPEGGAQMHFERLAIANCMDIERGDRLGAFGRVDALELQGWGFELGEAAELRPESLILDASDSSHLSGFPPSVRRALVRAPKLVDLSGLDKANLESLILEPAETLRDFSPLTTIKGLKKLVINQVNHDDGVGTLDRLRQGGCDVIVRSRGAGPMRFMGS